MRILTLALGLALAAPAAAQISGSINRDAPKVTTTIEHKSGAKITISYTALHFGEGQWQKYKDNEGMIERFNAMAERRPLGSVATTADLTVAGNTVVAGDYKLYMTLHAKAGWILNLKAGDADPISWRLDLKKTEKKHTRLTIALAPGEKANTCNATMAFGNMSVTVPVAPATKKSDGEGND